MKEKAILLIFVLVGILCPAAIGKIIYVDDDATGANDGSSWVNAYIYLQDALSDANDSNKPVEIKVAEGIYAPDMGTGITTGDREATFQLLNGVTILGGYAGVEWPNPNARDIELYETILSGDLNGDDVAVNSAEDLRGETSRAENSYNVVVAYENNETAILDGFFIAGGNANSSNTIKWKNGGGIYNNGGCPRIINCTLFENNADNFGGSMYNIQGTPNLTNCKFIKNMAIIGGAIFSRNSDPYFTNCTFIENTIYHGPPTGYHGGGAIYNDDSNSILINCTFVGNSTIRLGGGIFNLNSHLYLNNCKFSENSAGSGGGIYNKNSNAILNNCLFTKNTADNGGGIDSVDNCNMNLANCTFTGNPSINGSSISCTFSRQPISEQPSVIELTNCILWDDYDLISNQNGSVIIVSYSDIKGSQANVYDTNGMIVWDIGNISADPCFAEPGHWDMNDYSWVEGDYHLKSQAGRLTSASSVEPDPNSEEWVQDDVTSPCVDAGDPNSPIGYEPFPNGGIINMGAYGGTLEASMSPNDVNGLGYAYNPYPVDGATETGLNIMLNWKSDGWPYEIYFGTSEYPPFVQKQSEGQFNPGILEPDTQYYWRIDVDDFWGNRTVGDIWSFRTQDYYVVEDFEYYDDYDFKYYSNYENFIWEIYEDGWFDPNNGSLIGYPDSPFDEPFMEYEIVHSGNRSVPFYYNYYTNDEDFSEVTVDTNDLMIDSDWTIYNPETLVIWFYGNPDNPAIDQLYFKLNESEVLYEGDLNNFLLPEWWSWEIDLDDFNQDMEYIETITIGVRRTAPVEREGMVFLDDIRLY